MQAAVEEVRPMVHPMRNGCGNLRVGRMGANDREPTAVRLGMPRGEAVMAGKSGELSKITLSPY